MEHSDLIATLDDVLNSYGNEVDESMESISDADFQKSVVESEKRLDEEYFNIEQIRTRSLKDALNEHEVYI
jgi:ElaB/YqjD/DUF883 family membrane-anchored ribosome-binding protein